MSINTDGKKIKPNLADWFKDPPDSIPEKLTELVDCEHALKIVIWGPDAVFIFDKNLTDVHCLFNGDQKVYLVMHGRMDNENNYHAENFGDNVREIAEWEDKNGA